MTDEQTGGDALDAHREEVLRILARGETMGAAEIAKEVALEDTQVSSLLKRLQHDGLANRTAGGNWEIAPGAATKTEAEPHPKEPPQPD